MSLPLMLILATLAAVRTWRLAAVDDIGFWFRSRWDDTWLRFAGPPVPDGWDDHWRGRVCRSMREALFCPFCAGAWLSFAWVGSGLLWSDSTLWQLAAGGMAVSYLVGHAGAILDK